MMMERLEYRGLDARVFGQVSKHVGIDITLDELRELIKIIADNFNNGNTDFAQLKQALVTLAKAKADGRLVVLPCKVGDEIYFILSEIDGKTVISEPHKITEAGTRGFWNSSLPRDKPEGMHDFTAWDELGVTAFLTRAAAEAALKGEGE